MNICDLIRQYLSGTISAREFSDRFHLVYDLEEDETPYSEKALLCFESISGVSNRFSEFTEDHIAYPGVYYTAEALTQKVQEAANKICRSAATDGRPGDHEES